MSVEQKNRVPRVFAFNWTIYFIVILLTTVYAYLRLDYVRSGPTSPPPFTEKLP